MENNSIQMQSLLSQMRSIRTQMSPTHDQVKPNLSIQADKPATGFAKTLSDAVGNVNSMQMESRRQKDAFEMGDPNVSLAQVTLASQKAGIGFEAMLQVRNKFVEAYKEVMNMPV